MSQRVATFFYIASFVAFNTFGSESPEEITSEDLKKLHASGITIDLSSTQVIEEVAFALLKSPTKESYCLAVNGNSPSEALVGNLAQIDHSVRVCEGEAFDTVDISDIRELDNGRYTAIYGYGCGALCGGVSRCLLQRESNGELEVVQCRLFLIA